MHRLVSSCVPALLLLFAASATSVAAAPPAGQTYFVITVGFDNPYSWEAECISFTSTEICTSDGVCGSWAYTEPGGEEKGIAFEIFFEEGEDTVLMDGQARIDDRGKRDSLAAVARIRAGNQSFNVALSGRSTTRKKCPRLMRDFKNDPAGRNAACLARAQFGAPAESEYVLPFPVGTGYEVSGGYCTRGDHPNSIAYDFAMPIGAEVVAARAGEVVMVWEDTPDEPGEPRPNGLFIEHDDGTIGSYAHMTRDGVLVEEGQRVEAGQVIAIGGTSGTSLPHLHFMVYQDYPTHAEDDDVPVNFRNADGPLDEYGGLMWGYLYTALPETVAEGS